MAQITQIKSEALNVASSMILKEIDLTGTDAERKVQLDQFEIYWKDLTGASDMKGARFVGKVENSTGEGGCSVLFTFDYATNALYYGCTMVSDTDKKIVSYRLNKHDGSLTITPLFYHLEPVEILTDNSTESKKKNLDNLNAYKANLTELGVDTTKGFQVPIQVSDAENIGFLYFSSNTNAYTGIYFVSDTDESYYFSITSYGEVFEARRIAYLNQIGYYTESVIKLKDSSVQADLRLNKQLLSQLISRLNFIGVNTSSGYQASVVVTSDDEEYTGTLNIGTGTLLSGIVTDVNETHHYPFHIEVATGIVTFDKTNYFLEKTSNEVTEMLDAIKYSYTPVPLTTTTSTNKTQLEVFLSKVPNAQVMHVTYKDVYAGTLHKIGTDWFGLLVKNTNNYEDALQVKLQADGTLIEGTTSLAQVNTKLDNIIG